MWDAKTCEAKAFIVTCGARRAWLKYHPWLDRSHLEDLIQEGWVGALGTSPGNPHLPLIVNDQMREYLSQWFHGCSRSTASKTPRVLTHQVAFDELRQMAAPATAPEQRYDDKALVDAIAAVATDEEQALWLAQAESGTERLPMTLTRDMGYDYWNVSRHRQRLKRKAWRMAHTHRGED